MGWKDDSGAAFSGGSGQMAVIAELWRILYYPDSHGAINSILGWIGLGPSQFLDSPHSSLLSVMGVESGFNPFAESTAGASGLMQLMAKVHRDKLDDFGGAHIALNPVVNLRVGAVVLKDCIRRGGSLVDGLRLYVGAGAGDDSGYGSRVLQEKDRLVQVMRGNATALRTEPRGAPRSEPPVRSAEVAPVRVDAHPAERPAVEVVAEPKLDAPPSAATDEPGRVAVL